MPTKRQVLETLTRNELLNLADLHGLEVEDRRVRDQLIDAAASSRKVALADALAEFSRDRLKELCRELGLDEAGREKAQLVERLTGQGRAGQFGLPHIAEELYQSARRLRVFTARPVTNDLAPARELIGLTAIELDARIRDSRKLL